MMLTFQGHVQLKTLHISATFQNCLSMHCKILTQMFMMYCANFFWLGIVVCALDYCPDVTQVLRHLKSPAI